ncbi:MAG TPA: amidohydrolase, partial [Pseudonocardia sp.]
WQVEGLVDWQMPDEEQFSDYPRLTVDSRKKILGLNAARLYDIDVPAECQLGAGASTGDAEAPGEELVTGSAGTQA